MRVPLIRGSMRLAVLCLVVGLVAITILGGCSKAESPQSVEPVVVGGILPMTGSVAQVGEYMRQGMELALDDAIKEGIVKADDVRLMIEDSEANPAKGIAAYQRLRTTGKVVAVVPVTSGVILALKPLANKDQIVVINASAISPDIDDAEDFSFSIEPNANIEGTFLADYVKQKGYRTAGILYRNDPSGLAFLQTFSKRCETNGVKVVFTDNHQPGETDFRAYVTKVSAVKDMDVLFMASFGPEVATYMKQAAELGLRTPVIGYTTCFSQKVVEIGGGAVEGLVFSAPAFDSASEQPVAKLLRDKIKAKYGKTESNYYVASHYDAMMIVLKGIAQGARSGDSLRAYVAGLKEYDGLSGRIQFLKNGASTIPMAVYRVSNGRFEAEKEVK